jgi:hypothetical protein
MTEAEGLPAAPFPSDLFLAIFAIYRESGKLLSFVTVFKPCLPAQKIDRGVREHLPKARL